MSKQELAKLCADQSFTWPEVALAGVLVAGAVAAIYILVKYLR